jgi:hypothetical protein
MMIIPVTYTLFGPQHPGYSQIFGPSYVFPDTANTSSIITPLPFSLKMPKATWARWGLVWLPSPDKTSTAQLVKFTTDGRTPLESVEKITEQSKTGGPIPSNAIITGYFNQWVDEKHDLYLGIQFAGGGKQPTIIYRSTIEVWYQVPASYDEDE